MNKLRSILLMSLMSVLLMGSFASTQTSQLSVATSPQKMVAALKTLAQYVPSKELIAQVSKSMLIKGKSLITLSNAAACFGSCSMVVGLQVLTYKLPFLNRFSFLFNSQIFNIALQVVGVFTLKKMNAYQIRSFMLVLFIIQLLVDKYEDSEKEIAYKKYTDQRIKEKEQALVLAQKKIQEKNECTPQDLKKFSIQVNEKITKELLQQASSIARLTMDAQDQATLHKSQVMNLSSQLEQVKKQKELLQQELAGLNSDLSFELKATAQEGSSLEAKIKKLEDEKALLANTLTALNEHWTIKEALDKTLVQESLESDSKSTTPVNGSEVSDNSNQESSEESSNEDDYVMASEENDTPVVKQVVITDSGLQDSGVIFNPVQ